VNCKRIVVFSHFDIDNIIDDYVIFYLKNLRLFVDKICFVSTSKRSDFEVEKIKGICDPIIFRENKGYDFVSYKTGLLEIEPEVHNYDEILFCNDSVYGPLFDLEKMFSKMVNSKCDFWGVTENLEEKKHIQSYFVAIKKVIIEDPAFWNFIRSIEVVNLKHDIIKNYEIGLTRFLLSQSYKYDKYVKRVTFLERFKSFTNLYMRKPFSDHSKTKSIDLKVIFGILKKIRKRFLRYLVFNEVNPTLFFWKENIKQQCPFLKIELLRKNPEKLEGKEVIVAEVEKRSNYPVSLINNHLSRTLERYCNTNSGSLS
jgi:rhamnosyltransferase